MTLNKEYQKHIVETIKCCLRNKFKNYRPETEHMPFHYRLLGKDRMALFSFLQSLNTTFGTSIYEPIAKELAKATFKVVHTQYNLGNIITRDAQNEIQKIWTMKGMLDLKEEVKVAEEFWNFLSGQGTYEDLLSCFEQAGIELRPEIDKYFSRYK